MPLSLNKCTSFVLFAGAITFIYLFTRKMFGGHDRREPPLAPQSIPLVGHIIGISRSKFNYYVDLSKAVKTPIFTMSLPGQKMYVITKPELVLAVQKQHKEAQAILARNVNGDEGNHGLSMDSYTAMRAALKPGASLDDMNRAMIHEIARSLDEIQSKQPRRLELYAWMRDAITMATTRSVYGPMNPYEDPAIVDAFWQFESGLMTILIGLLPSLTAQKPVSARQKVVDAFIKYYKADGVKQASTLAQLRYQAEVDHAVPLEVIARYEVGGSIAVLVNTAPAAFWCLLLIHSTPDLLGEIRIEVDACIKSEAKADKDIKFLDITALKDSCPLLLSTYQEVLRYRSVGTSVREVMEDTYLDQWLLKKGAMLLVPSRIIHQDSSIWGEDVEDFNPRRFLNRRRDASFLAFGGGKALCPGRHFATNEILAIVAPFISRFDMKPVEASWRLPTAMNTNVAAVVMQPDDDVEVEITERHGYDNVSWVIGLRESEKVLCSGI
ncbi:putative cytochrome P450 [Xylariaceae sp. FL0255]|nr:putative cytochrome P450 [Xylariaceae sp. FL0255]